MYTLAVIDMQAQFLDDIDRPVVDNCAEVIKKAIEDEAHIMFVEYEGYGKTVPKLLSIPKKAKYKNISHLTKPRDDGGAELLEAIDAKSLPKKVKVIGINTDCCVYSTVRGYLSAASNTPEFSKTKMEVLTDACDSSWNHQRGVERLKDLAFNNPKLKVK